MPAIGGVDSALPWGNFKLEVAFASGPFDASPVWTDITSFWRYDQSTDITRGRQSEQDQVSTGTLSLTLDNTDGRFTVGNTSGAYYPNVKLRKQIRLTYTPSYSGASSFPIFKGYVDEWPVQWPTGDDTYAWAQVRASDRFKPLGTPRTLRSVVQEEILAPGPACYYPLTEGTGATQAGDISGNAANSVLSLAQLGAGGTMTFGTGTGVPTDADPAAQFFPVDSTDGKYLRGTVSVSGGTGRTILAVFNSSTVGAEQGFTKFYNFGGAYMSLGLDSTGHLLGAAATIGAAAIVSTNVVTDGHTHVAHLTLSGGGTFTLYLDGVSLGSAPGTSGLPAGGSIDIGGYRPDAAGIPAGYGAYNGTLSHVAVYATELSAATIARQAASMTTGFAGETTGARVGRVADWCGIATADRLIDNGSTTVRHVDPTGKTAQGYLQELADTEGGLVFIDTAGRLVFQQRSNRYGQTSAATLSTLQQSVAEGVTYRSNDQFLRNDVTYNRQGGITYRAVDQTSINDYGPYLFTQETYTTSDIEVRSHAEWIVYTSKTPTARIEGEVVDLLTDPNTRLQALALDLSDVVTFTGMPGAAPGSSATVFVEGIRMSIGADAWTMELNTSPADLYTKVWQLGVTGRSELDSTTITAF